MWPYLREDIGKPVSCFDEMFGSLAGVLLFFYDKKKRHDRVVVSFQRGMGQSRSFDPHFRPGMTTKGLGAPR